MSQPASSAVSKTTFFMWITGWVLTVLVTVLLCFSASMKLMRVDEAVKGFEAQKMGHLLIAIGITEVACAISMRSPGRRCWAPFW